MNNHLKYHHIYNLLCPAPRVGALSDDARLTSVCLTSVVYVGHKLRTERPRKTKIGTEVGHVTRDSDITFKVKRSKIKLQEAGLYCGSLQHSLFLSPMVKEFWNLSTWTVSVQTSYVLELSKFGAKHVGFELQLVWSRSGFGALNQYVMLSLRTVV